ncbi:MAG TPA: ankyrin repeat domain-containing protein, partial [Candidatus Dependentiae bacterium]|nr:ankyrin repeat domain-containing protein [Candidatus Dependentiae bacterium]
MKKLLLANLLISCSILHGMNIFQACSIGNIQRISELIQQNVNVVNEAMNDGVTSLHVAAQNGRHDVVRLLLD